MVFQELSLHLVSARKEYGIAISIKAQSKQTESRPQRNTNNVKLPERQVYWVDEMARVLYAFVQYERIIARMLGMVMESLGVVRTAWVGSSRIVTT